MLYQIVMLYYSLSAVYQSMYGNQRHCLFGETMERTEVKMRAVFNNICLQIQVRLQTCFLAVHTTSKRLRSTGYSWMGLIGYENLYMTSKMWPFDLIWALNPLLSASVNTKVCLHLLSCVVLASPKVSQNSFLCMYVYIYILYSIVCQSFSHRPNSIS